MTKVKICGLRRMEDIEAANRLRPDYIGFVFAKSRRRVSLEEALEMRRRLSGEILAVGVWVNGEMEEIFAAARAGAVDAVQLHGQEDASYIRRLREGLRPRTCHALPIIKAVSMEHEHSLDPWRESEADYLLLDTGGGGTGRSFDHSLIRDVQKPYFLAGGIGPDNVKSLIRRFSPYGVDVSSKVETDGCKDQRKMEEMIRSVRDE